MPPRPTTLPVIDDQTSLVSFLVDTLDWPIPQDLALEELTFDWTDSDLRLSTSATSRLRDGTIRQFQPLVGGQPFGVFLVEFNDPKIHRTSLRQIVRALIPSRRKDPGQQSWKHDNLLFICVTRDYSRISFAHFRGDSAAKAKLSTFGWTTGSTYFRTLFEFNLPQLHWPKNSGDTAGWITQWTKAFDKEPLTKEFFKRFDAVIDAAKQDLEKFQALPPAQAYSRAQMLIERLLFLYFLQNRGWLDQKRDFLLDHFEKHRGAAAGFTYYEDFLDKLFFTLATPPNFSGPGSGLRLPGIPFLNGGLFDDDEFAQTTRRRIDTPPLRIRNRTFAYIFDHLLEAFNFTVREDTPLNQDVAVDPEMLGKVFESIILHAEAADPDANAPDKRKATGSYYTPRIVVHFICRESLRLLLLNHVAGDKDAWGKRLRALLEIDAGDGFDAGELASLKTLISPEEAAGLLAVVEPFRCLDPSVGSGAFPVGLLHELVNLRRVLRTAADGYVDPVRRQGQQWIHETKAHIVENGLYGVDIQQQAIEICRLRLWLSLIVDYDLGVDPLQADRSQFLTAIKSISQLPNLEMNFRRGDSLLDMISGIPVRVEGGVVSRYRDQVEAIQKRGHELHKARKAEKKKELRLAILRDRLDLAESVIADQIKKIDVVADVEDNWFGESKNEAENKRRRAAARSNLDEALRKIATDRRDLDRLGKSPMAADFYPRLRKLEGADFDSPFNFVWNIDYAEIFTPKPFATLAGEMALVNEVRKQPELVLPADKAVLTPQDRGGFDLIVGNPPFVTARNPVKRELYRARWARVCDGQFLLICPFFDLSFGLLRPKGQLGFIVSNAFAKREFGQPLVDNFFPTINLQKIIDCSGLMFPGHGTPTCLVFGAPDSPKKNSHVRVVAVLPGGGDLRTPPEESVLWQSLAKNHENPGYSDARISVSNWERNDLLKWPQNFDKGSYELQQKLNRSSSEVLQSFLNGGIGRVCFTGADDLFFIDEHLLRRSEVSLHGLARFAVGDLFRNWAHEEIHCLCPYTAQGKLISDTVGDPIKVFLKPWKPFLENRLSYGETQKQRKLAWWEYSLVFPERVSGGFALSICEIATHVHVEIIEKPFIANRANPIFELLVQTKDALALVCSILNSSSALFWLKQVCFSKRESEEGAKDTYFEFAGGKVQQLPVPGLIAEALRGKSNAISERLTSLAARCSALGRELPALALRKLFEQPGEAYHTWNSSLPGHVAPADECRPPFATSDDLRARIKSVIAAREERRAGMIALQEEMDWLCYEAYGLVSGNGECENAKSKIEKLGEAERPFRFWAQAAGDFAAAVSLIPAGWSNARRETWTRRLEHIRDNEHIRRIEAPVYKRRWDEQWKVSNRWMAGPVAYAQELIDAFSWWLAEKAEWHLEQTCGPIIPEAWTAALWKDKRVAAAWPVIAGSLNSVEAWKANAKDKKPANPTGTGFADFAKFFRETVDAETVPDGIPSAVPWEELKGNTARAKKVRGKLNVPRERFRQKNDGPYVWAGLESQ